MKKIDFNKNSGLVPAIIQDGTTGEVLMLGYMNAQALEKTQQTGFVYFWSRSRKKLWLKGEQSGNQLKVLSLYQDCDADTVLVTVELQGVAVCHTGSRSCFYTKLIERKI